MSAEVQSNESQSSGCVEAIFITLLYFMLLVGALLSRSGFFFLVVLLGGIVYVIVDVTQNYKKHIAKEQREKELKAAEELASRKLTELRNSPVAIMLEDENGTQVWWQSGVKHRVDGPAVIKVDGTEEWWRHGKLHRVGGPAVVRPDGITMWCINGKVDRRDGPAIEFPDGKVQYWINDEELSKEEFDALKLALDNG